MTGSLSPISTHSPVQTGGRSSLFPPIPSEEAAREVGWARGAGGAPASGVGEWPSVLPVPTLQLSLLDPGDRVRRGVKHPGRAEALRGLDDHSKVKTGRKKCKGGHQERNTISN